MKAALYVVLMLAGFVGAMAGALAFSGNLNREGLDKILGKAPVESPKPEDEADDLDPILRAVKEREKTLDEREADLRAREERVKTAEQDLQTLRDEFAQMLQQYADNLDKADAEEEQRQQEVATLLEKMKPDQAAQILSNKEPEEAVTLLRLIPEKNRAKVLDKLDPEKAAGILDAMRAPLPAMPSVSN